MKTTTLLLLGLSFLLTACPEETTPATTNGHRSAVHGTRVSNDEDSPDRIAGDEPRIGMTHAQVRAKFGDPNHISSSPHGQRWVYTQENLLHAIPYFGPFAAPHNLTVTFGPNGRVTDFEKTRDTDY